MRKITANILFLFLSIMLVASSAFAESKKQAKPQIKEEKQLQEQVMRENLSEKEVYLVKISALSASSHLDELKLVINEGLDNNLTVAEIKDLMAQLYAYCGFPKSLNALGTLDKVLKERAKQGIKTEQGVENKIIEKTLDSLKSGTDTQTKLTGKEIDLSAISADVDYYLKAHLFGDIFSSTIFSWQEREIITVAALSAMLGTEPQRDAHIQVAKYNGVSDNQIKEIRAIAEKYKR